MPKVDKNTQHQQHKAHVESQLKGKHSPRERAEAVLTAMHDNLEGIIESWADLSADEIREDAKALLAQARADVPAVLELFGGPKK